MSTYYIIQKRLSARMHSKIESVPIKHPPSPSLPYTSSCLLPAALLQHITTFMFRMQSLCQQSPKFNLCHPLQQLDVQYSRLLSNITNDNKQSIIYELTNIYGQSKQNNKSEQYVLLVMILLYDLAKCIMQAIVGIIESVGDVLAVTIVGDDGGSDVQDGYIGIEYSMVQCIITQSIAILKQQKKHQSLQSKHNELSRILLQLIPTYIPILILKHNTNININNSDAVNKLYAYYAELLSMIWMPSTPTGREELRKNGSKYVEGSLKSIAAVVGFVSLQKLTNKQKKDNRENKDMENKDNRDMEKDKMENKDMEKDNMEKGNMEKGNMGNKDGKYGHRQKVLIRIMAQVLRYIQHIYKQITKDMYKLLQVLNAVSLIQTQTHTISQLPTQTILSIYPQLHTVYASNINQLLFSKLKTLKVIIQLVTNISNTNVFRTHAHAGSQAEMAVVRRMWYWQEVLHTSAHLLIQVNYYVRASNYYLVGVVLSVYRSLMALLLRKDSLVPLYLYTHLIINNIKQTIQSNTIKQALKSSSSLPSPPSVPNSQKPLPIIPSLHLHPSSYIATLLPLHPSLSSSSHSSLHPTFSQLLLLQNFLQQISQLFQKQRLTYFLKLYDWNFMEEDVCLNTIKYLYQFIENSDNQKRQEYELVKKCVNVINRKIQGFLMSNGSGAKDGVANRKQRKQFYQLKNKEYLHIVDRINKKPKDIFKVLQEFNKNQQKDLKEDYIQKCVRIIKRSNHIEQRAMLDFLGANNQQSKQVLQKYLQGFFKSKSDNTSLQHYLRLIISNFFLNGQAQQIVRFIDVLTTKFFIHQPQPLYKSSAAVYTFANAIILLNADQHNPRNPNRMSIQAFIKMCDKINQGQNLPVQILKQTYKNIKESEIHTYRNRYGMQKISLECWTDIVNDYESVSIKYYDEDMKEVCEGDPRDGRGDGGFGQFANELLLAVIDEKQTQKLQAMIQRFQYDDKKFDCEIIQKIRTMIVNKKHIAMHALQKIYEVADFKNKKSDQKMVSYCWLAAGIIQNFYDSLPFSKVAEYLLKAWKIGFELKDNLQIRQNVELKTIKKCIKQHKKKQSKKSIMDMFSKFLSSKDSEDSQDNRQIESPLLSQKKKLPNLNNTAFTILQQLMKSPNSRARAAQTILLSLRHQQSRRFQQFVSCLYLIFHLVYGNQHHSSKKIQKVEEGMSQIINKTVNIKEDQSDVALECAKIMFNLLEDFYCLSQPHLIGSRITSLKTKNLQKYELVYNYAQFWTLKLLFKWSVLIIDSQKQSSIQKQDQNIKQKIKKLCINCLPFISKINVELLTHLVQIIDTQQITITLLTHRIGIPIQVMDSIKCAMQAYNLKYKNMKSSVALTIKSQDKQPQPKENMQENKSKTGNVLRSKSEPSMTKQQQENDEEIEKYIKNLQNSTVRSQEDKKEDAQSGVDRKLQQQIQQDIKKQLGINQQDTQKQQQLNLQISESKTDSKDEQKNAQKLQNQKIAEIQNEHNDKINQNGSIPKLGYEQARDNIQAQANKKQEDEQIKQKEQQQKKSSQSNQSGEEIGLPVYML